MDSSSFSPHPKMAGFQLRSSPEDPCLGTYMSPPSNPGFYQPASQQQTPPATQVKSTTMPVSVQDLYKFIVTKTVSQCAANYGGDSTQIPPALVQTIRQAAHRKAMEVFGNNRQAMVDRHNARQQHRLRAQRLSLSRSPNSASQPQIIQDIATTSDYTDKLYPAYQHQLGNNQDMHKPFESTFTPGYNPAAKVLGTPIQFETPTRVTHDRSAVPSSDQLYLEQFENDSNLRCFRDDLGKAIEELNRQNSIGKTDRKTIATTYPFQQNRIVVAMTQVLLEASGLAAIVTALSTQDCGSLFVLTQSAASNLNALLPQLQVLTRKSLGSIVDPTSRRAAVSKTFTGFYDCFSGIKERLCVEDRRRRRNSQERLATTMRHTRAQVWLYLAPKDDDELTEECDHHYQTGSEAGYVGGSSDVAICETGIGTGAGNGYGSGYAIAGVNEMMTPEAPLATTQAYTA